MTKKEKMQILYVFLGIVFGVLAVLCAISIADVVSAYNEVETNRQYEMDEYEAKQKTYDYLNETHYLSVDENGNQTWKFK